MEQQQRLPWWKSAVVYQVYPRSFQDTNGDGIGDIQGIINRLDYLQDLGINAIWLSPVCRSSQKDNGYDVSDYRDIDDIFGTIDDMDRLIAAAKERDIRIILDLVLNHTSDQHPWFQQALQGKDNPYHDYYVFRDGKEGVLPANTGTATFGGPMWTFVPELGQYYFHQFASCQPDLNWENPEVRAEIYRMMNWWIDKGVGGFRFDVIDQIAKEPDKGVTFNGSRLHEYLLEMNEKTFGGKDLLTVGEAWGADVDAARRYSNPNGSEFSMVFQFSHMWLDAKEGGSKWDAAPLRFVELKKVFSQLQDALYNTGWNSLFWNNHDLPRAVSRFGNDKEYRVESAKMLAILLHGLQGTPFIYQGEELGMTNVRLRKEQVRDIEAVNVLVSRAQEGFSEEEILDGLYRKGRDNARTPMQWTSGPNAGFTTGTPWIDLNPNYTEINAERQQHDPDSVFATYRTLIRLRRAHAVFVTGKYEPIDLENPALFLYTRTDETHRLWVLCNFTKDVQTLPVSPQGMLLISNYADETPDTLRPYEAKMILEQR